MAAIDNVFSRRSMADSGIELMWTVNVCREATINR
jgi:hypothetical protein